MRCHYNMVSFLPNPHNRHPIAALWVWTVGCLLWVESLDLHSAPVTAIKSPRYTGGDFMFLFRFIRRHRRQRRPQILVHAITLEQLFGFLSFLTRLLALTYRLTDWISGDFLSWPWPWIFKVKYRIGYISAKNGPSATKQKANTSTEL